MKIALASAQAQRTVLTGIFATLAKFANVVNLKDASLQASDLASCVDPNYLDDGHNADMWRP